MSSIGDRITTEFCKNRVAIRILQKPGQLMAAALPLKGLPSRVVEGRFDDIDAIAASPLAWDQEYEQIGRGRFQGQLTQLLLDNCNWAAWFGYPAFCGGLSAPIPRAAVCHGCQCTRCNE